MSDTDFGRPGPAPRVAAEPDAPHFTGWLHDPAAVRAVTATLPRPLFGDAARPLAGSGQGKTTLLYKAFKEVNGEYLKYPAQTIGDCFPSETAVLMADGGEKAIDEVRIGDEVLSGEGQARRVTDTIRKPYSGPLVRLRGTDDGREVLATPDHRFRGFAGWGRRWVPVGELAVGDEVLSSRGPTRGHWDVVAAVERLQTTGDEVYCLEVEKDHSFVANGFVVHNCVSQGCAHGVDLLACVQIALGKRSEAFHPTSTEAVYGMARVDIGGERGSYSDGAVGAWAAKAVSTLGTVSRDVTGPYDGRKAREWGARGVPADVKAKAAEHKVKTVSLVTSYEELEDALANGYPVTVASNQGFAMTRDADGGCRARGHWSHQMLLVGVRTEPRPQALIFQSWGVNVPDGPLTLDQPDNAFWADRDVVAGMLAVRDSWALSNYDGYPGQPLPSAWSYASFA